MNKSIKILFNYLLGPLLFLVLSWSMYCQLKNQQDLQDSWQVILQSLTQPLFWFVFLLLFFNWGLESLKWQYLMFHLEQMKMLRSFISVLAGTGVTMLTPNRTGEFAGRILFIKKENRIRAISLTVLGSMSQLMVTLVMGLAGWCALRWVPSFTERFSETFIFWADYCMVPIAFLLLTLLFTIFLKFNGWLEKLEKKPYLKKIVKYLDVLHAFTRKQLLRILLLSFFRYLVFTLQYALMLKLFVPELDLVLTLWAVTIFYLIMAVVPSFGWAEIPMRAAMSAEIFMFCTKNVLGVQVASLSIWMINLLLPAILGALCIAGNKFIKTYE